MFVIDLLKMISKKVFVAYYFDWRYRTCTIFFKDKKLKICHKAVEIKICITCCGW
jgi:hypothetical protein